MIILFLTRLFYPHIGGVEKHVMEISKQLVADGHTVIVVTENTGTVEYEEKNRIKIYRIRTGKNYKSKKFQIWLWLLKHKKFLEQADIIHCHDVFFWYLPFRFLYLKKPAYITFHGYETVFPPTQKAKWIRKLSEKFSWGNICVGEYISKWYGTKADYITYGGTTSQKLEIKNQNDKSKIKLLFLGRLESDNGIPIYLQALDILKKKDILFMFEAYGDGSLKKVVEQYGKVHGFIENISDKLESADIIFASSYLSILESFAKKKLVFSVFDNPLKKDYLIRTPFAKWIHPTNSPEKLANTIIGLLKNKKEYNNSIEESFAWVEKQTWKNVVKAYYKLWL